MSTPGGGLRRSPPGQAPDERAAGARALGWLGLLGGLLAVGAACAVVLSDDVRWLRLGVVAALWAGLLAGVVLVRRSARSSSVAAAEAAAEADRLRRAYESELESEVAARQEFEQSLEHDLRRELAAELAAELEDRHSEEIAGLRAEVERLQADRAPAPVAAPPQQRMTALDSGPGVRAVAPPAPPPAPHPAPPPAPPPARHAPPNPPPARRRAPAAAAPAAARSPASMPLPPTVPPPPPVPAGRPAGPRADAAPAPSTGRPADRATVLDHGSFVDQYVRTAGGAAPTPPPRPEEAPASATTGRTVAELLAAHAPGSRGAPHLHHRG